MSKRIKNGGCTRANDLSGSLEGAGGIGSLLARTSSGHSYYFADGNGNITYMLNSSQNMVASYRYDPFGNTISKSGALADANVYRFSSKEFHVNSGLYYFGYRFYDPSLQRWPNRDPIEEITRTDGQVRNPRLPTLRISSNLHSPCSVIVLRLNCDATYIGLSITSQYHSTTCTASYLATPSKTIHAITSATSYILAQSIRLSAGQRFVLACGGLGVTITAIASALDI